MKQPKRSQGLSWSPLPQNVIERELRAQDDMVERGRRLRDLAFRKSLVTLDGTTLAPSPPLGVE